MKLPLLVFFILSLSIVYSQKLYIPPFNNIDSITYNHYTKELSNWYYRDSISPNWNDKHGKYISYYHLNAPSDTVFKYLDEARYSDPVCECWIEVLKANIWTKRNKRLEPRRAFIMNRFCDSLHRTFDSSLIRVLDTMWHDDQKYRKSVDDDPWLPGNEKKWIEQHRLDSINEIKLDRVTAKKGYPGENIVGHDLRDVAFMIIQHGELSYQEKYFPILEKAAKDGQLDKSNMPMLIDRMNMRKGIAQIYGTQAVWNKKRKVLELYKVQSLKDVNRLRAEYDMGKLSDYLMRNHIEFPQ